MEALHHIREAAVYNPASLSCARFRVESTASIPVPVERVRACTEGWVDVAGARIFHAHRSHGSSSVTRQKVIHVKQKAEQGQA